jgi:hypothetical protein
MTTFAFSRLMANMKSKFLAQVFGPNWRRAYVGGRSRSALARPLSAKRWQDHESDWQARSSATSRSSRRTGRERRVRTQQRHLKRPHEQPS